jgi:hypothetical protein
VRAGELAADLGDLDGAFSLCEHDFGETDAAEAVEVERVVGSLHGGDDIRAGRHPAYPVSS